MKPARCLRMTALALLASLHGGAPAQPVGLQKLAWLQGCWSLATPDRSVDEQWMGPRAGSMLGMSRTVRGERLTSHEWVLLRERGGRFEYEVNPSGQAATVFTSTAVGASSVLFENPQNDFPQRIGYERDGGKLLAWIDGPLKGQNRRIDFAYSRVPCGGTD